MELTHTLVTSEGRSAFDHQVATLIRARNFARLEGQLLGWLQDYPSSFTGLCRAVNDRDVHLEGWANVHAGFLGYNFGNRCTAVALDLINRQSVPHLALLSKFYHAADFPAVQDGGDRLLDDLLDDLRNQRPDPRTRSTGSRLEVVGLEPLTAAIRASPYVTTHSYHGAMAPHAFIGTVLAHWFVLLRVHQAVQRDLAVVGMPRAVPVFVGVDRVDWPQEVGELDYDPTVHSVYWAGQRPVLEPTATPILPERQQAQPPAHDQGIEEIIEGFRVRREGIRGWRWWVNPAKRRVFIEYCTSHEALLTRTMGLRLPLPTWKLSDAEFEQFIQAMRAYWTQR